MDQITCTTCKGSGKAPHPTTGEATGYPCPDCLCMECRENAYPLGAEKCSACGWSWKQ